MDIFRDKFNAFLSEFGHGRKMVLSTSENDHVSSRMMSIVQLNGAFFFQTDLMLRKYQQLIINRNVALCIDNIQIEGKCEEIGHPMDHTDFAAAFQACFKGSFDAYTGLKNERLFIVRPAFIERWVYKNAVPYIETFDIENSIYSCEQYHGE